MQRLASGFADRAVPKVQDTPEYRYFRTLQIYGEAVRDAESTSEGIDSLQRAAPDLSAEEASAFERELDFA